MFYYNIICIFVKIKSMEKIKEYLSDYLKKNCNADDYDINNTVLNLYLDSLDIVDLVLEIENHYNITIEEYHDWGDVFLNDIVKYINEKIC